MTENQQNNPDNTQSIDEETFDPRDLVTKGGYSKNPREIIENPAVAPQMLDDRRSDRLNDGVGMDRVDNQDSE
ncbi:hypothetical protein IQ273_27940 [Nodosilinea sp. LEGE 07298]|jgi:hypothetical protein|uniref:hypothetical protein n=1 Tax=Nodosilinea sp. LEGE 07298 TaxID=2777970 RepID=UPI00187F87C2|nr:hypothetical protein [Nodosilinea sp. LEGE 07298]MBE9113217.1 hypothetical protein [Nodosilinea sp. LEGE 07298]